MMRRNLIFWFPLIEAQFAAAGIKTQKLKYVNALPKQVLWDILDTLDVCNNLDHPCDLLKEVLLGQFGMSKWQSYIELLRLEALHVQCKASSPAFSWGISNNICLLEFLQTQISSWPCFSFAFRHP
jgi:hypothetical protein